MPETLVAGEQAVAASKGNVLVIDDEPPMLPKASTNSRLASTIWFC
jgi:hypothetical protein